MNTKSITIAILTHNRSYMVSRAIRSALQQINDDFEMQVVVVDDCSEDETAKVLKKFGSKIEYIRNDTNLGVGSSSNIALRTAKSDYFVRLDSDDYFGSLFCATALNLLTSNPNISLFTCNYLEVDEDEIPQRVVSLQNWNEMCNFGAGMVFRTQKLLEMGGYKEGLRYGEDLDLHLRLGNNPGTRYHFPVPLYRRKIHSANLSSEPSDKSTREEIMRHVKTI